MKKLLSIGLSLALGLILVACGGNGSLDSEKVLTGESEGFKGAIKVQVTKDSEGKIEKVEVLENDETPEYGGEAIKTLTQKIAETGSTDVDVVSGATITSNALIKAINEAK